MRLLGTLREAFRPVLEPFTGDVAPLLDQVQPARDARFGDYQANFVMRLAKQLGEEPTALAERLVAQLQVGDICHAPEVAPRGFINLRLSDSWLGQALWQVAVDDSLGCRPTEHPRQYILDYSSPNVAKPMHVGHIRSTVIGDALNRILRFLGHRVVTDNHLGDWGTQFGMIIYGYKHLVDSEAFAAGPVAELSRLYRAVQALIAFHQARRDMPAAQQAIERGEEQLQQAEQLLGTAEAGGADKSGLKAAQRQLQVARRQHQAALDKHRSLQQAIAQVEQQPDLAAVAEQHAAIAEAVLAETAKLHQGDPENVGLWKKFLPDCLEEIEKIYRRLGVKFDTQLGESFFHERLHGEVEQLLATGLAQESQGAVCVFLDGFDAPMIVRKQDGAFLYATTDLATLSYRIETYRPDAILYVVDHRQGEHFEKLFATAALRGYPPVELQHISFGTVLGPDQKPFKTRSGSLVGLEQLLDEAVQRAWGVVCDPDRLASIVPPMDASEMRAIAEAVGIGAIKYADLHHNRTSDYCFDIDKMVQLDGNTATYIQYACARSKNILRRFAEAHPEVDFLAVAPQVQQAPERELVLHLLRFEDALHQVIEAYYPNLLASYLYDLAKLFASFFEQCPVLQADSLQQSCSRMVMVSVTARTLSQGLDLLGIPVLERM
jgi:arginyl-tRNA synthetase